MSKRDLNGYAIGGLAGGEDKDDFWRTIKLCTELLPDDKPRYVMGIGYAEDLMICSLLGANLENQNYIISGSDHGDCSVRIWDLDLRL